MKINVLYSSGLDSYVMLHYLDIMGHDVTPVFIKTEGPATAAEESQIPAGTKVITLDGWFPEFKAKDWDNAGAIYTPGRNLVYGTLAATVQPCDAIAIGALREETHNRATDKNYTFGAMLQGTLSYVLSPFQDRIEVMFPLADAGFSKVTGVQFLVDECGFNAEDIDWNTTSCWHLDTPGETAPCGRCKQCLKRATVFARLGIARPYTEQLFEGDTPASHFTTNLARELTQPNCPPDRILDLDWLGLKLWANMTGKQSVAVLADSVINMTGGNDLWA